MGYDPLEGFLGSLPEHERERLAPYLRRKARIIAVVVPWVRRGLGVPLLLAVADRVPTKGGERGDWARWRIPPPTVREWLDEALGRGVDFAPDEDDDGLWAPIADLAASTDDARVGELEWVSEAALEEAVRDVDAIVARWGGS